MRKKQIKDLTSLEILAQCEVFGSFSGVANERGVAVSSISRQIHALEASIGVPLLQRAGRTLTLTREGRRLREAARQADTALRDAVDAVTRGRTELSGRIALTAPRLYGEMVVAPLMAEFQSLHPGLAIDLECRNETRQLAESEFDLAVRYVVTPDPNIIVRRIGPNDHVLVANPDYVLRHGDPESPAELVNRPLAARLDVPAGRQWQCRNNDEESRFSPAGAIFRSDSMQVLRRLALAGSHCALLPLWMAAKDLTTGRLVRLMRGWDCSPTGLDESIYLAWPEHRRGVRAVSEITRFLLARLQL